MEAFLDLILDIYEIDPSCIQQLFSCRVEAERLPWHVDKKSDSEGVIFLGLEDLITSSINNEEEYAKYLLLKRKLNV